MSFHKLLAKQIQKHLSPQVLDNPEVENFLHVVSESYIALERDRELAERAFSISEEEYIDINRRLKHELELKRLSILKLKEAVLDSSDTESVEQPDDLLLIARELNAQVSKRKNAEKVFTSLITNMQSGVLLEDENRRIVFTNQLFCQMFGIEATPDQLVGADCTQSAEYSKHLFSKPDEFVAGIEQLLANQQLQKEDILELADGRIFQRDYIPIFIDKIYKGHLWSYTDITEKRRSQDAIEKSELKNRLVMNASLDAIITADKRGVITYVNPKAETIFGWHAHEMVGKKISTTIIPPAYREAHGKGMRHYNQTGEGPVLNKQLELSAIDKSGREFPIEMSIVPVKNGDEEFFCAFMRDISERKKSEQALKASEELWQFALEGAGDGVWEYDFETGEVFFSRQYKKLLGFEETEFDNKASEWYLRIHPDDVHLINQTDRDYIDGTISSHSREYRIMHKSGFYMWVLDRGMMVSRSKDGKPKRIIGTQSDITERKLAEQAIRFNEEKYRSIITNMKLGLVEVDNNEIVQFANQSFCEMSGFPLVELIGRKASAVLKGDNIPEVVRRKTELRKKGISDAYELQVKTKSGHQKWWLVSGAPRYNDNGELVGSIGIHLDISEQKILENELRSAREQAEFSSQAKQSFLANMSHEIRTPLNAILGMGRQLAKTSLEDQQRFFLKNINDASENLLVIINDILDISKIEAGKLALESIPFRIRAIFQQAVQISRLKAEEKGLSLDCDVDDSIAQTFMGDPHRLNQVLLNLLSNAIKFTHRGAVKINCTLMQQEDKFQQIQISVADSGIGMEQEFMERLFESFMQEDKSVSRKFGGTGLGMSITKHLVTMMSGSITVKSTKNVGTTFFVDIPFEIGGEHSIVDDDNEIVDTSIIRNKRILLVEDNEINRMVATATLANYYPLITEVVNGREALDALKAQEFDLVLMDMQMPVMDGLRATRLIRSDLRLQIPIIALTANAIKGENEICFAAGMNDYVSKPFKEEDLVGVIVKWLNSGVSMQLKIVEESQVTDDALFDLSKIRQLSRNNDDFIKKMIDMFCQQVPVSISAITRSYNEGDLKTVKTESHKIKPSLETMGVRQLAKDVREIEALAAEGVDSSILSQLVAGIHEKCTETVKALEAYSTGT
jgi:PAS domain S-box-containing protein